MRGFLGGVSFGALVAATGALVWSLSVPLPQSVDVSVADPEPSPVAVAADTPVDSTGADPDVVETPPAALGAQAVEDDLLALEEADRSGGARPQVGTDGGAVAAVSDGVGAPLIDVGRDAQVTPVEPLPAPDAPGAEQALVVATEPAQPPAPDPVPEDVGSERVNQGAATADVAAGASDTDGAAEPQQTGASQTGASQTARSDGVTSAGATEQLAPSLSSAPQPAAAPLLPGQGTPAPATVGSLPGGEVGTGEDPDQNTGPNTGPNSEPTSRIAALPTVTGGADAGTDAADDPQADAAEGGDATDGTQVAAVARPRIGTPAGSLVGRDAEQAGLATTAPTVAPFVANAEPFTPEPDRALMSIVLIDDAEAIGAEALRDFPYPLTFALDPNDPRAAEKMRAHRASGFEVVLMVDLPREATPQDAETALAVWLEQLPQAVAILEGVGNGFQGNRPLADQMVAALEALGYGMVTQDAGLNTVQKLALRNGMPAGVVFRDFDGAGQDPRAIRRFLDQAAFRAGQEGAVIMLGRAQPDTISSLLLWGLQDRASRVSLAPVSASLRAKLPAQ
ncbi:polysaccharide deacteylase family 2 protein [Phaeobacter sp.]|uniref:polysaccharide deacteylase family 2 protein n=1 Tax=Phaeobacter sp. TaxID=1902409 RepID=UPI0025D8F7D9|nr:polysaccharide deacteylase family 2 protein [Phaeobacter sp.]